MTAMENHNKEVLENLITAAVNTNFKEIPPSEEDFVILAEDLRRRFEGLYNVSDDEFNEILGSVRSNLVILMDLGVFIDGENAPHKSWLPARRADLDFFFWNRYKKFLESLLPNR